VDVTKKLRINEQHSVVKSLNKKCLPKNHDIPHRG
jgi:hypothetical protein